MIKVKDSFFDFDKTVMAIFLLTGGILWIIIAALSEGCPMAGDAYSHYRISRYAFDHPELFLYHWGKPLYTSLSSPFTQMGYFGARLFNVFLAIASAYLVWRCSVILKLNYRPLVILFVLFTPYYALLMLSAMTEILFSFVLILSVFLFFNKNYTASAIVISFLPFARTEGFGFIPLFILALILVKNWKPIPFLFTGTLFFSLIGYFHYHDFFWVFTQMPYSEKGSKIYGSGDFLFYYKEAKLIFGWPLFYLIGIGGIAMIYKLLKDLLRTKRIFENNTVNSFVMIFGIFFGYIFMQSLLWYKGWMGVLGSARFLVSVVPLGCLIALYALNLIPENLFQKRWTKAFLYLIVGYFVIVTPFQLYRFPWKRQNKEVVTKTVADWVKETGLANNKIWYYDPVFFVLLDFDPYDLIEGQEFMVNTINGELRSLPGDVFIWDAHFGPNEGKTTLQRLMNSDQLLHLKKFEPQYPFKVLGGHDYEVHVFQKLGHPLNNQIFAEKMNALVEHSLFDNADNFELVYFNPFSGSYPNELKPHIHIYQENNQALILNPKRAYFAVFEEPFSRLIKDKKANFSFSVDVFPENFDFDSDFFYFVVTVKNKKEFLIYRSEILSAQLSDIMKWQTVYHTFEIDCPDCDQELITKLFLWYQGEGSIMIDNPVLIRFNH
jgi:hypothetical protein